MDRRTFLRLGAGAVGTAAVLGSTGVGSQAASGAQPKMGGQLLIGTEAEVNGINPLMSQLAAGGIYYARAIFDPLAIVASDGSVRPYLCQSITPNATYTTWTFTLRPGITFHDGTTLDGATLANNFQHVQHSPFSAISAFSLVTSIQQTGPLTVTLELSAPWVALPAYLTGMVGTGQLGFVAAPSMLANPNGAMQPVGTGPFIFESWEPGSHLTVKRNPNYWQKGLPYLSGITFMPIVDDTSRYQSLESGTLDLISMSSPLVINEMLTNPSITVLDDLAPPPIEPSESFIMLNTLRPPLNDVRVRRALAYATNQKKVIQVTGGGLGAPSTGLFPPGNPYYAPTGYPSFNLAKAKALVAQYKADHGGAGPSFPLQIAGTTGIDQAQQLQQMWKQAGINVSSIVTVDQSTFISQTLSGDYSACEQTQYEAADPDQNYSFWSSHNNAPLGQAAINFARFSNPTVDAALQLGRSNPSPAVRKKAYQTVNNQFAKYVPYVWITRAVSSVASAKTIQGYKVVAIPSGGTALAISNGNIWMQRIWKS